MSSNTFEKHYNILLIVFAVLVVLNLGKECLVATKSNVVPLWHVVLAVVFSLAINSAVILLNFFAIKKKSWETLTLVINIIIVVLYALGLLGIAIKYKDIWAMRGVTFWVVDIVVATLIMVDVIIMCVLLRRNRAHFNASNFNA